MSTRARGTSPTNAASRRDAAAAAARSAVLLTPTPRTNHALLTCARLRAGSRPRSAPTQRPRSGTHSARDGGATAAFDEACELIKSLPEHHLSRDTLLQLYGLYKQATVGPAQGRPPPLYDLVGRAKWCVM